MKTTGSKGRRRKKGKKILWIVIVLVLIAGIAMYLKNKNKTDDVIQIVEVCHASRSDLDETISTNGTAGGYEEVPIYAPANGIIKEVYVVSGEEIGAGTKLFDYDIEAMEKERYKELLQEEKIQLNYENTLEQNNTAKAKVKEAETNLKVLETQINDYTNYLNNLKEALTKYNTDSSNGTVLKKYDLTKRQAELTAELQAAVGTPEYEELAAQLSAVNNELENMALQQSLITKSDYVTDLEKKIEETTKALSECQAYKAEMEAQKSAGESAQMDKYSKRLFEIDHELAEISKEEQEKDFETAKSGVSSEYQGVITTQLANSARVSAGMQVGTLTRTDKIKVTAYATQYVIERLKVNQKVEATINGHTYHGEVSRIDRSAIVGDRKSIQVRFEVELTDSDDNIFLGCDASMTIHTNSVTNALSIPATAVCTDKDGEFVYVVENQIVRMKRVESGVYADGRMEILSGITEQDVVINDRSRSLAEGMTVQTFEPAR